MKTSQLLLGILVLLTLVIFGLSGVTAQYYSYSYSETGTPYGKTVVEKRVQSNSYNYYRPSYYSNVRYPYYARPHYQYYRINPGYGSDGYVNPASSYFKYGSSYQTYYRPYTYSYGYY